MPSSQSPGDYPQSNLIRRLGLLLLLAGSTFGCAAEPRPPDLLLITVDTLRADHLGFMGYERSTTPNLDRLSKKAAVFEHAYSTQSNTTPSVVSLLSGLYPQEHRVRMLYQLVPETCTLLPDLLPDDYSSAAFVSNYVLTDEATGLASRFDHYDDLVTEAVPGRKIYERSARETTDAVLRWLRAERDRESPLFLWVHYVDPHGPYHPPAEWRSAFSHSDPLPIPAERIPPHQRFDTLDDGLEYIDRYDEEIAFVDAEIGRLVDAFPRHPRAEPIMVFTADHGESMMEHEKWFSHGYQVYEEIVRVPLMIRGPGVRPGRHRGLVSGIDVAPTILRLVGVKPPDHLAGIDILNAPEERTIFVEATRSNHQWRAALRGDQRWFLRIEPGDPDPRSGEARLYDLGRDPDQRHPQTWDSRDRPVAELLSRIAADPDPAGRPASPTLGEKPEGPKIAPRADDEALEKLRALGYVD